MKSRKIPARAAVNCELAESFDPLLNEEFALNIEPDPKERPLDRP